MPKEQGELLPKGERTPQEQEWAAGNPAHTPPAQLNYTYNQQINLFGEIVGFKELEEVSPEIREGP